MKFQVCVESTPDGQYWAMCADPHMRALGRTAASALDNLRDALRYHLEMCPCSTIDPDLIELQVL